MFDRPKNFYLQKLDPPPMDGVTIEDTGTKIILIGSPTIDQITAFQAAIDAYTPIDFGWSEVRTKRNNLLLESDWTQLLDAPIDTITQNKWKIYRQSLRDIPQAYIDFDKVVWPAPPK